MNNKSNDWKRVLVHGVAVAGGGAVAAFVTCPLDVIRTLLQVQQTGPGKQVKYVGIVGTFRTIWAEEGIRGYYKGLTPTLMALIPNWSIYFFAYNLFKQKAIESGLKENSALHMVTAMSAGAITDVCVNPLWVIKTRLQTQRMRNPSEPLKYTSIASAFRIIVKEEGSKALFKGLVPQFFFGLIHVAIQFPLYEYLKKSIAEKGHKERDQLTPLELGLASSASKIGASVIAYPHEVLRVRFQYQHSQDPTRYKSLLDAIARIFSEEGWRAFYKGMLPNLLRVTPTCAVTFTSYEILARKFQT